MGQTILMGRKTLKNGKSPTSGRQTIILTTSSIILFLAEVVMNIEEIVEDSRHEDIYVCGGAQVYNLLKNHVELLYCTRFMLV